MNTKLKSRWFIRRIPLNSSGYAPGGFYYGGGISLWIVYSADGKFQFEIRGHRDNARLAYEWSRRQEDVQRACNLIIAFGFPKAKDFMGSSLP